MLESVNLADSWAWDSQVWLTPTMEKVLFSEDMHTEKCPKNIFRLSWDRAGVHGVCELIMK